MKFTHEARELTKIEFPNAAKNCLGLPCPLADWSVDWNLAINLTAFKGWNVATSQAFDQSAKGYG